MYALAFCGQVDQVQKAFKGPLSFYPEPVRQFWLATAELAAGNDSARQQLLDLHDRVDAVQKRDRLATLPPIGEFQPNLD